MFSSSGAQEQSYLDQRMSMKLSTTFINACLKDCITDYRDDNVSKKEQDCLHNCAKRVAQTMQATGDIRPPEGMM